MSHNDDADNPYEYMDFDYSLEKHLMDHEEKLQMEDREKAAIRDKLKKDAIQNKGATISPPNYFSMATALAILIFFLFIVYTFLSSLFD